MTRISVTRSTFGSRRPHHGAPGENGWVPSIVLGTLALWAIQAAALGAGIWGRLDGTFSGPDSYMRLHRVLECAGGPACPGGMVPRSNAPYGELLHWPWLWDWGILAASMPFRPFLDVSTAVTVAAYLLPPLLGALTIVAVTLLAKRHGVSRGLPYVGLLAATQPYVVFSFAYSRPDHHGLQTALFAAALLGTASTLVRPGGIWPRLTGVAIGLGVWVSTEGLIATFPLIAAVGIAWVMRGGGEEARKNRDLALAAGITALFGVALDGPLAGLGSVEFDRLSVVHVVLFGVIGVFWEGIRRWGGLPSSTAAARAGLALAGGAAAMVMMSLAFPGFERGPTSGLPDFLWTHWLNHTSEFVPLVERADATEILMALAPFLFALPVAIWAAFRDQGETRYLWWSLAGALLWFEGLAVFQQVRWSTYVQLLSILPLAWFLDRMLTKSEGPRRPIVQGTIRVALVSSVALGPALGATAVGLFSESKTHEQIDRCEPGAAIETLAALRSPDGGPATILAPIFWGPEILFRTEQRVVATPYHRNVDGIMDSHRIMSGTPDEARRVLADRTISHIVMCPDLFWIPVVERTEVNTLYRDLVQGRYPTWAVPVDVPANAPGIRIIEVVAASRAAGPTP